MVKRATERERQAVTAHRTHFYLCEDGELFVAGARTESGAFCVLQAERPYIMATYLGSQPIASGSYYEA